VTLDPLSALPAVPDTALPADVRSGSSDDKQTYKAALAFERQLLTQLLHGLDTSSDDSSDSSDDDDGSSVLGGTDAATNAYKQQLPDQMADAVINGGGTGLAENLYRALHQQEQS
jgi:hypothetical protein